MAWLPCFFSLHEYYRREKYALTKTTKDDSDDSPSVHERAHSVCSTPITYPDGPSITIDELMESIDNCQNFFYQLYGRENWQGTTFFFQWKGNFSKSPLAHFKGLMWLAPFVEVCFEEIFFVLDLLRVDLILKLFRLSI